MFTVESRPQVYQTFTEKFFQLCYPFEKFQDKVLISGDWEGMNCILLLMIETRSTSGSNKTRFLFLSRKVNSEGSCPELVQQLRDASMPQPPSVFILCPLSMQFPFSRLPNGHKLVTALQLQRPCSRQEEERGRRSWACLEKHNPTTSACKSLAQTQSLGLSYL